MNIYEACPEVENESFLLYIPHINDRLYEKRGSVATLARQRHGFPRGEAVERSETDEERRYRSISYSVRKKGTT